jgi:hypothetical protein
MHQQHKNDYVVAIDTQRRSLLKWGSLAMASAAMFGVDVAGLGLQKAFADTAAVDLGSGDIGILNYAYALEQLEAAFYTEAVAKPFHGMTAYERDVLMQIKGHEVEHRDFLKKALGEKGIPDLKPNFTGVDFNDRMSVLKTASTFEDLGVSAYNGAGAMLKDAKYLAAAGTIVSVEARHAAILRDILMPLGASFAGDDVVDASGLDVSRIPSQVLPLAAPFIATPITATQLS